MVFLVVLVKANIGECSLWAVPERIEAEWGLKVGDDDAAKIDVCGALAIDEEPEACAVGQVAGGDADGMPLCWTH